MAVHRSIDASVLKSMTTPGFEFARETALQQGLDLGLALLGDRTENPPAVILLELPPGHVLERHAHGTYRMEIVLRGSMLLADGRELRPGDVTTAAPGEFYGPLTAGREGCLSVEIFAEAQGLPPLRAEGESAERVASAAALAEMTRRGLGS